MAKTKQITNVPIKGALLKEPKTLIQSLTSHLPDLRYTKVIQTYIFEKRILKVSLLRDNKVYQQGELIWIGNRKNELPGIVLCYETEKSGEIHQLYPTEDTMKEAFLDLNKNTIKIYTIARLRCAICGKSIEIFDESLQCPACGTHSHKEHLIEYITSKGECPSCQRPLGLNSLGVPVLLEEEYE
ncbi:MAG: hypothetical protein ACTSU2_10150 [Promethearchaeota archaeon]